MNNMKEKLDDDYQKWPSHPFTHFLHIYIYSFSLSRTHGLYLSYPKAGRWKDSKEQMHEIITERGCCDE